MKVRIKSVPEGWSRPYLTKKKEYEAEEFERGNKNLLSIVSDRGQQLVIRVSGCASLDGGSWEIIPEHVEVQFEESMK
jgi:hypothetical protein